MIKITNRHHRFYVGRGNPLGNPFVIGKDGTRDEVIEKYQNWLYEKILSKDIMVCSELNKIYAMALDFDVSLECSCVGFHKNCHAYIIKDIILDRAKLLGKIDQICEIKSI